MNCTAVKLGNKGSCLQHVMSLNEAHMFKQNMKVYVTL